MAFPGCLVGAVITLVVRGLGRRYTITLIYNSADRSLAELRPIRKIFNHTACGIESVRVLEYFT